MAEQNVIKTTIEVASGSGATYVFAIPSLSDEIRLGMRERSIRRETDPGGNGDPTGLDIETYTMIQAAARFELLLRQASVQWPFSTGDGGKPVVVYTKFPTDKIMEMIEVSLKFQVDLNRFRSGGVGDGDDAGTEVMEGQPPAG